MPLALIHGLGGGSGQKIDERLGGFRFLAVGRDGSGENQFLLQFGREGAGEFDAGARSAR